MFRRAALSCLVVAVSMGLAPAALASFPGKDGKIVFEQDNLVVSVAPDGTGLKELVHIGYNNAPSCSADGDLITYSGQRADGWYDIFIVGADGKHNRRLMHDETEDYGPSFSPNGKQIVFSRKTATKELDLFIMGTDGKHRHRLFSDAGTQRWPRFSPNGKRIVFESNPDNTQYSVWIMKADGSNAHEIAGGTSENYEPSWTPDGKRVLFIQNDFSTHKIYSMKPSGKQVREVPTTVDGIDSAVMAPSGKRLAMTTSGTQELFRQNLGGSPVAIAQNASYTALDWCTKPKG
jgi:Tol biopolymer transport system component